MNKLCKDCEHFHIRQGLLPDHYDTGLAECRKYGLVVDFYNMRKFNTLTCAQEEKENEKMYSLIGVKGGENQ